MKVSYLLLISLLIVGALFVPAVSAEYYTFDLIEESTYHSSGLEKSNIHGVTLVNYDRLMVHNSELLYGNEIVNVFTQTTKQYIENYDDLPSSASTRVTIGDWGKATYGYFKYTSGSTKKMQIYLSNFERLSDYPDNLQGRTKFNIVPDDDDFVFPNTIWGYPDYNREHDLGIAIANRNNNYPFPDGPHHYRFASKWENTLTINTQTYKDEITLIRNGLTSQIDVLTSIYDYRDTTNDDYTVILSPSVHRPYSVIVKNPISGTTFSYNITSNGILETDPLHYSLTVYIKNSQTGALIANSNIVIDALVNNEYYPVVNRTEPSGIFSINLQPTGGGPPNPDGYRLIVTADGYNNPMPEINFTVDDYKQSIYCLLDPIAGGPADENKTFIDFFVSDMYANPVSGATVKFGKYTLITNSAGYTVFEVPKNDYYTYTVSKPGYNTITGNANIGDAPRNTINTYLTPVTTPTTPTHIPTGPPTGPTPVMTAPTGEPVSNWLEWFAAHFGMILGGGVEIGKIFMWLCFTVPVGVYVGKEAKAGAAGFMAGAGIVTLFFVLIGWVPIWLVVLLALIIGLLYAKVFNTQDNGGGR